MPKRKYSSSSSSSFAKRRLSYPSSSAKPLLVKPSQKSKMMSILKGHTETAITVLRKDGGVSATATVHCLTSSTPAATAAENTGQLGIGEDSAQLNYIEFRGTVRVPFVTVVAGNFGSAVRVLIVRYFKPLLLPDASGTLPPITEVLEADDINALPIANEVQNGRFHIISDKMLQPRETSDKLNLLMFNYKVKLNTQCKFERPGQTVAGNEFAGGHYDSGSTLGRVSAGLLCMYIIGEASGAAAEPDMTMRSRLNFTA